MTIFATAKIPEELNKEMRKISAQTGLKLSWLYLVAIEEYVERNKVVTVEQSK